MARHPRNAHKKKNSAIERGKIAKERE